MTYVLKNIRNRWKCCFAVIALCVLINEWLLYITLPWIKWPQLHDLTPDSVKLLVVSDPQLLGERYTYSGILGLLARWDADRYITRTFRIAFHHVQPDIILFLGDLMDEGEIASDEEYKRYFERYKKVFSPADFNRAIMLPGDNDIGGENEPPSLEMEKRFNRFFKKDQLITYRFLEFVKVNYMTQSSSYLSIPSPSKGMYRIILSHIPLMSSYGIFSKKSKHLVSSRERLFQVHAETAFEDHAIIVTNLTESKIHEIMNPTCSYRMGTMKVGYGAVVLGSSGFLKYAVLWLPSRFYQHFSYLGLLVFVLLVIFLSPSFVSKKMVFENRNGIKWS